MAEACAQFRFYEELNDFLPLERRKRTIDYAFNGHPGIKDPIEALGVPHPEVELVIVNGHSVGFDYQLNDGDRVAVYPCFESLDVSPLVRLRDSPLRRTRFILDVHLGKLARHLRLLGFDTVYRHDFDDCEIIATARCEHRIVLTRDRRLLFNKAVTHGYYVRSALPLAQTRELLHRFDLYTSIRPFERCMACNGILAQVPKAAVADRLPPRTNRHYEDFSRCTTCARIYWEGSHYDRLAQLVCVLSSR